MKVPLPALARATCTSAVSVSSSFQEGFVDRHPGGPRAVEELVSGGMVNGDVRDASAVLLADYRKGALSSSVVQGLVRQRFGAGLAAGAPGRGGCDR